MQPDSDDRRERSRSQSKADPDNAYIEENRDDVLGDVALI